MYGAHPLIFQTGLDCLRVGEPGRTERAGGTGIEPQSAASAAGCLAACITAQASQTVAQRRNMRRKCICGPRIHPYLNCLRGFDGGGYMGGCIAVDECYLNEDDRRVCVPWKHRITCPRRTSWRAYRRGRSVDFINRRSLDFIKRHYACRPSSRH